MKTLPIILLLLLIPAANALVYEYTTDPALVDRCFLSEDDYSITQPIRVTKIGNATVTEIKATPSTPSYDDLLYGQLLNKNNEPWGGQNVRITWTVNGEERFLTTKTLTREEALLFGDPLFEGYYFFSKKRVGEATYKVEVIEETTTPVTAPRNETKVLEPGAVITPPQKTTTPLPPKPNPLIIFFNAYWGLFALIFVLIALVAAYQWYFKKSLDKLFFRPPKLSRSLATLNKKPVRTFMKTDLPLLDIDASIRDLLTLLLQEEYALVVTEGRFLGLITAEDIIKPLYETPAHKLTVKELLIHPRTVIPTTPFGEAAMLSTEYHVLPVIKNSVCVGVVERKKILMMYDELYSLNPSGVRKVASLQHAITQAATIAPGATVRDVVEKMIAEDVSMLVVADEKPQSIVTEKDVVQELIDYRDTLALIKIDTFTQRLITAEATSSLLDANRLMLDNNLRAIPITHRGLLVGLLTQRSVLHELYSPLKEYA